MEVLGGSHSYTHHCVNDENTHRHKRSPSEHTEHAAAITASCCLAAWRNQKPHIKLPQPELHTYHLLIGNTDKNHPFPILSRVQPSDSFINGHEINTASVSTKRTSSKIFVKILYDLISENHLWKISTSEDLIKCWSWNWFQHWWAWTSQENTRLPGNYCIECLLQSFLMGIAAGAPLLWRSFFSYNVNFTSFKGTRPPGLCLSR